MSDLTARLALPLIAPGQAQKEIFHNEALARIDAALHPLAQTLGDSVPPVSPAIGACWIVGATPSGAWSEHADALAAWTDGGWRFVVPVIGMTAWIASADLPARWDGTAWRLGDIAAARLVIGGVSVVGAQQPAINPPSSGSVIDLEARAVLSDVLAALSAHGLIGM